MSNSHTLQKHKWKNAKITLGLLVNLEEKHEGTMSFGPASRFFHWLVTFCDLHFQFKNSRR